jgi:hypothetical protein
MQRALCGLYFFGPFRTVRMAEAYRRLAAAVKSSRAERGYVGQVVAVGEGGGGGGVQATFVPDENRPAASPLPRITCRYSTSARTHPAFVVAFTHCLARTFAKLKHEHQRP